MLKQRLWVAVASAVFVLHLFNISPASAGNLAERLSAYTGPNAHGYFGPFVDGFAADLTAGTFHRAYVPESGFNISFEVRGMRAYFGDENDWFIATTGADFSPETQAEAPTVVGPTDEVRVVNPEDSTAYQFPSGFNIRSLSTIVPQLRVGSLYGTEALVRYAYLDQGSALVGDLRLRLYGGGLRHNLSQHFSSFPLDMAVSAFYQRFGIRETDKDEDLVTVQTLSLGVQAGKRWTYVEPYAGLAIDRISFNAAYEVDGDRVELNFDGDNVVRLTLGLALKWSFLSVNGEYDLMSDRHDLTRQDSFSVGIAAEYSRP